MNAADGAWGIAIMNVQANIPAGLSDQVVYMMLGDVTVENAVAPEEALAPVDPVTVTTSAQANLYNAPGKNAAVVGTFPAGSLLEADSVSPDGQWLRVLHVTGVAWVPQEAVEANDAINDLPLIDRNARAPMQSFRLTTGTGTAPCVEAILSVLVVQGPQNFPADITANGVNIRVLSTIFLRTLPGNVLQIITGNGTAIIHPGTPNEIVVPPAFSVTFALDESGSAADAVPSWTLLTQREIDQFAALVDIPGNVWNFAYQPPVIIQPSGVGRPTPTVVPTGRPPRPPKPPFPIIPWPPGRPGRGSRAAPGSASSLGGLPARRGSSTTATAMATGTSTGSAMRAWGTL
ncbi:MAG: SH3 domain-containing protein [Anaerolineae bacterium]|nr:SH3 domain-containing protein [Anaerolineae bacterium]